MAGYPSLAGRTIFISGGGSGIGACIVERFAQQGSRVAFCDVADEPAQALVARLAPAPVRYGHCDVRDIAALRATLSGIETEWGPITVLVNNAARVMDQPRNGTRVPRPAVPEVPPERGRRRAWRAVPRLR